MRKTRETMRQWVKPVLAAAAALAVIVLVLLLVHFTQVRRYKTRFLPGTMVNGTDVSGLDARQAADALNYVPPTFEIRQRDGSKVTFSLSDIGGSYSFEGPLSKLISEQDTSFWLVPDPVSCQVSPDLSCKDEAVRSFVAAIPTVDAATAVDPTDAYIRKTDAGFEIVPETLGSRQDPELIVQKIETAVRNRVFTIDASDCYEQPDILASDLSLTDTMQQINSYKTLYINLSGGAEEAVEKKEVMSWIDFDPETLDVSVNMDAVKSFTRELAGKYNTLGTVRTFTTHGGHTIQVGGSDKDTMGYEMDQDTTASRIAACALTGQEAWAKWPVAGFTRTKDNDFGDTYVEVSIDYQHLWYYENGTVVLDTDVVTGTGTNSTTPGVFMVLDKQSPAELTGPGYVTPVEYWMPVTYTGTGLHDAKWRSSFGKEIYVSGGSHGCVNMPTEAAAALYSRIEMGTPVIIYKEGLSIAPEDDGETEEEAGSPAADSQPDQAEGQTEQPAQEPAQETQ